MNLVKPLLFSACIIIASAFNAFSQDIFPDPQPDNSNEPEFETGYIINLQNDTTKCEFDVTLTGLRYRPEHSQGKFSEINTDKVKEYYSTFDHFTYQLLSYGDSSITRSAYLKILERGSITLYEKPDSNYSSPGLGFSVIHGIVATVGMDVNYASSAGTFCISKENGPLRILKSNAFGIGLKKDRKGYILSLMTDDPDLAQSLADEKKFNIKTLRSYIHNYNVFKSTQKK